MFNKLKERWRVNEINLVLIIITFAFGGSLCGYLGKKLLSFTTIEKGVTWFVIYIIVITLLWPLCVLLISIPFGQYGFFKKYLVKIWNRIVGEKQPVFHIAVFASGAGSNAQKIIDHFRNHPSIKIALVVCNKTGAGVLTIAAKEGIPTLLVEKKRFLEGDAYLPELKNRQVNFIVLAGFLLKIPAVLLHEFPNKIINIHPALLPKHGGQGMFGSKVHEAVIAAKEKESGITIHYVDEEYDHGKTILQAVCTVDENDTAETLAQKIHILEHRHYPETIANLLQNPK